MIASPLPPGHLRSGVTVNVTSGQPTYVEITRVPEIRSAYGLLFYTRTVSRIITIKIYKLNIICMKENSTITLYRFSFNLKFWTQSNL